MTTLRAWLWAVCHPPALPWTPVASYGRGLLVSANRVRIPNKQESRSASGADEEGQLQDR